MFELFSSVSCLGLIVLVVIVLMSVRIAREYERAVVFRLGRVKAIRGPGLYLLFPLADRGITVDLRVVALDVPSQEAISKDNVTVKVNAVVYYHVRDPKAAIINVEDFRRATWQIAQTSLRNVIGQSELDELLAERNEINLRLREIIDEATEPWGVQVNVVEVKDVELPDNMKRAMAKQAEAERERRAKIISAEGEMQAARQLAEAARMLGANPAALQLRYLQTLTEISAEQNSTILFPLPIDIFSAFLGRAQAPAAAPGGGSGGTGLPGPGAIGMGGTEPSGESG
jgi:regulator of protease activity HflC (stomatin/prohibitin superfamily)